MKIRASLLLSAMAALPSLGGASPPTNPTVRGQMDAMFAFCVKLNPAGQSTYRRLQKSVMGLSSDAIEDGIEKTLEYRQAFDFVSGALDKTPRAEAVEGCKSAAKDKGRKEDRDGDKAKDKNRR